MPSWTKEQLLAINESGKNIIVSAGAGSGKTAVLSERVITKLKQGINVNELLILTFTNEASNEMKQRIRKEIEKDDSLKDQLDYLDSAYITTFDSFALSIIKKYHYLLNISKNIINLDQTIINIKSMKYLNEIFEDLYNQKDKLFRDLINEFCFKDDKELKEMILDLSQKLDLQIDKQNYLDNYIKNNYNEKKINKLINEYEKLILEKIKEIASLLNKLLIYAEGKYYEKSLIELTPLINATTYDEIKLNSNKTMPRMYNNAEEKVKNIKDEINKILKELKEDTKYNDLEEIKSSILNTKNNIETIIKIINLLDNKLFEYKYENNAYSFNDIAKMSIQVVRDNEEIKNELKYSFKEIMIDEYQDTSDIQEEFISLIENNNVYMVGDIKQSIYRFRNANPNIFREKYNNYSNNINGFKIDLLKNFRSRKEVLDDINIIFNLIMDEALGGAEYSKTHQMIFGNNNYEEIGKTNHNNNLEILNYKYEDKKYSKEEIEVFTIANDIKQKINSNYQVFDKNANELRKIKYSDFCIIMDRGSEFDKYKKILEYLKIPTSIYQDEKLTNADDIIILKNILGFILKIYKKEFDIDFKYYFTSIARSYLFSLTDQEIFNCFKNKNFYDNEIYKISKNIANELDNLDHNALLEKIINDFKFYEKTILVGSINSSIIRLDNMLTISKTLSELGFTKEELFEYLEEMIKGKQDIKYSVKENSADSVKIMNIHKSKGLEFPICYFSGFHKEFNMRDVSNKIIFDNTYGIIIPTYKEEQEDTIIKKLLKDKYKKEEISEKIRLLYVALTRAKEKMIIVTSLKNKEDETKELVAINDRLKYKSFLDIFNSIKDKLDNYIKEINIEELNISKDYNEIKEKNYKEYISLSNIKIINQEIEKDKQIKERIKYSKTINKLITEEEYRNIEYGKKIHKELEENDEIFIEKISKKLDLKNCTIYREYEFISLNNNEEAIGIIDLLLEYQDHIKIIDYKLKNIEDKEYIRQLNGYKNYISNITKKPIKMYLYSINEDILKELK